jgi:hypothetical protein
MVSKEGFHIELSNCTDKSKEKINSSKIGIKKMNRIFITIVR